MKQKYKSIRLLQIVRARCFFNARRENADPHMLEMRAGFTRREKVRVHEACVLCSDRNAERVSHKQMEKIKRVSDECLWI